MMRKTITIILLALFALTGQAQTKQEADSLHLLGRTMLEQGRTVEGREYTLQAMEMRKALYGENSEEYINSLNNYALSYNFGDDVDLNRAIELEQQVMTLCENLEKPHPDFGLYALNMGRMYYIKDDPVNAAKYWEKALVAVDKYGEMYEFLLNGLGMIYSDRNDMENMQRIMVLMEDHNQHELQKPCEEVRCMIQRGQYFAAKGDDIQAKTWFLNALSIAKGEEKIQAYEEYGKFLGMTLNDYASGADYMLSAASFRKELHGENEDYYQTLNTAGMYCYNGEKYQNAIDCYAPVIDFYKQQDLPSANDNVAQCLKNMGDAYRALGDMDKADECYAEARMYDADFDKKYGSPTLDDIIKKEIDNLDTTRYYMGEFMYANSLYVIASSYRKKEEYDHAVDYYERYMTALRGAIEAELSLQSEAKRIKTWNRQQNAMQDMKEMLVTLPVDADTLMDRLSGLVYDVALLSKGALWDTASFMTYTWQDVKKSLHDTDIAVEFLAISESPLDEDNIMAAMVLTKDMAYPMAVPVCTLADVTTMKSLEQRVYDIDNVVWGVLTSLLQGKQRIFFSPDGGFNSIEIEKLKYNGKPLSEQYEVYRLISTKELCCRHF